MIKRKIDRYLADFFDTHKKALMLTGARQIGKTYSIRRFFDFVEDAICIKTCQKTNVCHKQLE